MTISRKLDSSGNKILTARGASVLVNDADAEDRKCCCRNCCKTSTSLVEGTVFEACCFSKTSTITLNLSLSITPTGGTYGCLCASQDFDVTDLVLSYYGCDPDGVGAVWMSPIFESVCDSILNPSVKGYYSYTVSFGDQFPSSPNRGWRIILYYSDQPQPFQTQIGFFQFDGRNCCGVEFSDAFQKSMVCATVNSISGSIAVNGNTCCRTDINGVVYSCCECEATDCTTTICDRNGDCGCECRECDIATDCADVPDTISVSLGGMAGGSGTYVLTRDVASPYCSWSFTEDPPPACPGSGSCAIASISVFKNCNEGSVPGNCTSSTGGQGFLITVTFLCNCVGGDCTDIVAEIRFWRDITSPEECLDGIFGEYNYCDSEINPCSFEECNCLTDPTATVS